MNLLKLFGASVLAVGLLTPAISLAADGGGSDGCGLGWQVTDKKTLIATTTRGTTNFVVPPAFGMTTGTIGCDQHSFAKNDQKAVEFVASNYEPLMMNLSAGRGEYLEAFAQTLNCKDSASFGAEMQKNYSSVASPDAVQVLNNVKNTIKANPALAANCSVI
jgi:hypothetical protein